MEISAETRNNIQSFIKSLTGANDTEINNYISEILSDKEFFDSIARKGDDGSVKKPFSLRVLAMDTTSCLALYVLCRASKPGIVVETGVASGMSSSYILRALNKNDSGKLFSIDVPWYTVTHNWKGHATDDELKARPIEEYSGWIIPDGLRDRWKLFLGRSSEQLPILLNNVGPLDLFFHDSEHSYENMSWEFQTVWPSLRPGSRLLAHNVDKNNAFLDFERSVGGESFRLSGINNSGHQVTTGGKIKN